MIEDDLVSMASAGDMQELSGLVSVNGIFAFLCVFLIARLLYIVNLYEDFTCFLQRFALCFFFLQFVFLGWHFLDGPHIPSLS